MLRCTSLRPYGSLPVMTECSVEECSKDKWARGWCQQHYNQWKNHGDPTIFIYGPRSTPIDERFWSRVDAEGDCWLWTGPLNQDGYGRFWDGKRVRRTHKWAYEYLVGAVPLGFELDHLCRVTACVNPDHLEPVTHAENMRRGIAGFRKDKQFCKRGHEFVPENIYTKSNGGRQCRECTLQSNARIRERKRT